MEKRHCNFESGDCNLSCPKYAMCSYMSVQKQLSKLQEQINFIYSSITNLITSDLDLKNELITLNKRLESYTCELLDIYNKTDSETNNKESISEKEYW